jgi:lipid-A-disaccharide synthase
MRRYVNHLLCKLPFEVPWYEQRNCRATYVGHPYFDQLAEQILDAAFELELLQDGRPLLTLLPGSRDQEVRSNLPTLIRAAQRVQLQFPGLRVAIASFNRRQAALAADMVAAANTPIEVFSGKTAELIRRAECCLACSGSVSLELLYFQKPSVIVYRVHWLAKRLEGYFRRVRFISLVNLLASERRFTTRGELYDPQAPDAGEVPFPEYLTSKDCAAEVAEHAIRWLRDPQERQRVVAQLGHLRELWGKPGASLKAAEHIDCVLRAASRNLRASA